MDENLPQQSALLSSHTAEVSQQNNAEIEHELPVSVWAVVGTIVLPVLWGIAVHWFFQRFWHRKSDSRGSSSWPDYQI